MIIVPKRVHHPLLIIPLGEVFPCMRPAAFLASHCTLNSDCGRRNQVFSSSVSIRSEFQIMDRSLMPRSARLSL